MNEWWWSSKEKEVSKAETTLKQLKQKNISKTVKAKEEKYVWVCTLRLLYALLTNGFWNLLKNIYNK